MTAEIVAGNSAERTQVLRHHRLFSRSRRHPRAGDPEYLPARIFERETLRRPPALDPTEEDRAGLSPHRRPLLHARLVLHPLSAGVRSLPASTSPPTRSRRHGPASGKDKLPGTRSLRGHAFPGRAGRRAPEALGARFGGWRTGALVEHAGPPPRPGPAAPGHRKRHRRPAPRADRRRPFHRPP